MNIPFDITNTDLTTSMNLLTEYKKKSILQCNSHLSTKYSFSWDVLCERLSLFVFFQFFQSILWPQTNFHKNHIIRNEKYYTGGTLGHALRATLTFKSLKFNMFSEGDFFLGLVNSNFYQKQMKPTGVIRKNESADQTLFKKGSWTLRNITVNSSLSQSHETY